MPKTLGNLEAAKIYEVDEGGEETGRMSVSCMFNPFEYTISKSNSFKEKPANDADRPKAEFSKAGAQTLKLSLFFDTYEKKEDVSRKTVELWKFMEAKEQQNGSQNEKKIPPFSCL